MERGGRFSRLLPHAALVLVCTLAGGAVSSAEEPPTANDSSPPPAPVVEPPTSEPAPSTEPAEPAADPSPSPGPADPVAGAPADPVTGAPADPVTGAPAESAITPPIPPPYGPPQPGGEPSSSEMTVPDALSALPSPPMPLSAAPDPMPRPQVTLAGRPRQFAVQGPVPFASWLQDPDDRVKQIEDTCAQRPRSRACLEVLAPVSCSKANPIKDGAFSCAFAKRRSPCYQDYASPACALYLDDTANPCLRRPNGPSCYLYLSVVPAGCDYPPDDDETLTPECSAWVWALTDLCQTSPESCPGPYGGSQEILTVTALVESEESDDELPIDVADSEGDPESAADSEPGRDRPVALASTGLDLLVIGWIGLGLLAAGVLTHAALRASAPEPRTAPTLPTTSAAPLRPLRIGTGAMIWTSVGLVAFGVLIRLLFGSSALRAGRSRAAR